MKFHDQISALWEYDKTIQLSDADVDYGAAHAAMLRDDLIFEIPEPAKYRQAIAADHPERGQGLASSMQRERKMCLSENPMVQESIGSLRLFAGSRAQLSSRLQLNEQVQNGTIEFARIDTKDQLADGFTKALGGPLFKQFRDRILHTPDI